MKNKIIINCLTLSLLLGLYGCSQKLKTGKPENATFNQTSNWIILNKIDGVKHENTNTWNFELRHRADYVIQVVFNMLPVNSTKGKIRINEQEFQGVFKKSYTTYDYKMINIQEKD